ncbi:hypothetical protein HRbin23_01644 [bacterium HR23]|nr:hypothetical protein HRbin23_01644 [bacterium HR23]
MRNVFLLLVPAFALLLGACAPGVVVGPTPTPTPPMVVEDVWARPSPSVGGAVAVYLRVVNPTAEPDILLGAAAHDVAGRVELHETTMEGGMAHMHPRERFEVPAQGVLELKPGGKHIMLLDLKRELKPGDRFTIILSFERRGPFYVEAEVRSP